MPVVHDRSTKELAEVIQARVGDHRSLSRLRYRLPRPGICPGTGRRSAVNYQAIRPWRFCEACVGINLIGTGRGGGGAAYDHAEIPHCIAGVRGDGDRSAMPRHKL